MTIWTKHDSGQSIQIKNFEKNAKNRILHDLID